MAVVGQFLEIFFDMLYSTRSLAMNIFNQCFQPMFTMCVCMISAFGFVLFENNANLHNTKQFSIDGCRPQISSRPLFIYKQTGCRKPCSAMIVLPKAPRVDLCKVFLCKDSHKQIYLNIICLHIIRQT